MPEYAADILTQVEATRAVSPVAFALVAFGTTFFGNLVAIPAMVLGFSGKLGHNGWFMAPLAVLSGHYFGDASWYTIGRGLSETRAGDWIRRKLPRHKRIERFFETGSVTILAVSKLLAGTTMPILFLLGWYRTRPERYLRLSFLTGLLWFVVALTAALLVYSGIRLVF